ncbi:MAG: hypothetical protein EAY75_06295 [Bacteroidetes bacterium]|nr:MAG: hypothetical protein EAY75_06295 [Bacteroidota bacterium]
MNKSFEQIWTQLRAKKTQYHTFLEGLKIEKLRGIDSLSVRFDFPVTVIAGANATGKSTLLFACACAYKVPEAGIKDYVPTTLFPNLVIFGNDKLSDSDMGGKGPQPSRAIYFRTLANLTSPSEVRSVLQIGKGKQEAATLTSDLIAFAMRILPLRYKEVSVISKGDKNLLFAVRDLNDGGEQYSEFHMSAGERAILRISKEISRLKNALVLIDEIEAGMRPYTQQQLMLELQRIALRNDLQIIVTSHSPVIIDSVPLEARVFLERSDNTVKVMPAYKAIIQKALYGQSIEKLNILCEDDVGESFLLGIMDVLNPRLNMVPDDIVVGRDTGKSSFPEHIRALGKFNQLMNFVFVLDGDAVGMENLLKQAGQAFGATLQPLFIPGQVPEDWAWQTLEQATESYALLLGISTNALTDLMAKINHQYNNASDKPANIIKNKFSSFSDRLKRTTTEVMRLVSRTECEKGEGDIKVFTDELESQIRAWQARK